MNKEEKQKLARYFFPELVFDLASIETFNISPINHALESGALRRMTVEQIHENLLAKSSRNNDEYTVLIIPRRRSVDIALIDNS